MGGGVDSLAYTPNLNYYGEDSFTYRAFDGIAFSEVATVAIIVSPLNDPPEITDQVELATFEDVSLEIILSDLLVTDVDNDYPEDFTLTVIDSANYTVVGIAITPDTNFVGILSVPVYVDDGTDTSNTFNLAVTVTPVNDAPVLTELEANTTDEDIPLTITLTASDVENDDLTYSAVSNNENVSVLVSGDQLTMTPASNYNGSANITVTLSDGFLTDEGSFELSITPVNDSPIAFNVAVSPTIPVDDDDLILNYDYSDVDGDDESGTTIAWFKDGVEQPNFAGQTVINFSETQCDEIWYAEVIPFDGTAYGTLVTSNNVDICSANDPPEWVDNIPDQHLNEDSDDNILTMEGLVEDESLVQLDFNVFFNSDTVHLGASFAGSDLILTSRIENYYTIAPIQIILTAFDGDYTDYTDYINVYINPVNDPPVLNAIGDQNTDEDAQFTINLSGVDIDGDDLSFSAISGDISLVTVFVNSNQLTVIPTNNWFGSVDISVTVSDDYLTDSEIFTLSVTSINDAPVLSAIGLNSTPEDVSLITTLSASDIDGDELTFSAESYSANIIVIIV